MTPRSAQAAAFAAHDAHGDHAHAFAAVHGERTWCGPAGEVVAYADTGRAWVAAGAPLVPPAAAAAAADAFAADAARARRLVVWFAVEDPARLPRWRHVAVGALPEWSPAGWQRALARHRRLREQLRRARAKGVTIRRVDLAALSAEDGATIRRLEDAWARTRRLEPMAFVVARRPTDAAARRRAWIAEVHGRAAAFATATPIPARRGWLLEDVLRDAAPNGTTELLFDAAVRDLAAEGAHWITPGVVPLAGDVAPWLRTVRRLARPLYDFDGLAFFRGRLHPDRWRPVYIAHPHGVPAWRAVLAVLRAFAGGSVLRFGTRSLLRRPAGLAWGLALGLVPWTAALAVLLAAGRHAWLGFTPRALAGWVVFDAGVATTLWAAARTRRPALFAAATAAAALDAALSLRHLAVAGLGGTAWTATWRLVAAMSPLLAALLLASAWRTLRRR